MKLTAININLLFPVALACAVSFALGGKISWWTFLAVWLPQLNASVTLRQRR
jgi:hypothetical protein